MFKNKQNPTMNELVKWFQVTQQRIKMNNKFLVEVRDIDGDTFIYKKLKKGILND